MDLWGVASRADVQLVSGALLAAGWIALTTKTGAVLEHFWLYGAILLAIGDAWLLVHVNGPFAWGGLVGLIAGSAWALPRSNRVKARRDDEIAEFARTAGLTFATSRADMPMHLLDTLSGYDGLSALRVVSGSWHETLIIAGEYRYADYSGDDLPGFGVLRFGMSLLTAPAPLIVIRRHHALTRLRDKVKPKYLRFGDARFDDRFRVTSDGIEAARLTLSADARAWLADNDPYGSYLLRGHDIVVLAPYRHDIQDVTALLNWLRQFRAILEKEMTHAVG